MKEIDAYKFQLEIELFKSTLAPSAKQLTYLADTKEAMKKEILDTAKKSMQNPERVLLTAICGELHKGSSKQEQAEFGTRLLLLDLLTERK
jgi:hypothetical protein